MKLSTRFITIKTVVAASILLSGFTVHAETTQITVNGMVCAFCAQGIESALSALPETKAVYVDLTAKVVAIESKSGMTLNTAKIKKEIEDAGYDTVKFETIASTVAELKTLAKNKNIQKGGK
jgi:cation transport ATPase